MAEPESILQLGIEAARDGNKEEARNLFRLLTRQEPQNAQAWLWLAGVAETREERQAALERVVEIEPTNDMALKGLQALGVRPGSHPASATPAPAAEATPAVGPYAELESDDPFAELDALSDVMAEAPAAIRRADTAHEPQIEAFDEHLDDSALAAGAAAQGVGPSTSRSTGSVRRGRYDEDEEVNTTRRPNPIFLALIGVVLAGALIGGFLLISNQLRRGNQQIVQPPPQVQPTTGGSATVEPTSGPGDQLGGTSAVTPTAELSPTQPVEPTTEQPAPTTPPPSPAGDPAVGAAPALVAPNTPLESNGWSYNFSQPNYATSIIGALNGIQPQGRFVVVLMLVSNTTGQSQTIPADFFVLKDGQGRVYNSLPNVSTAYVIPGVNADLSQEQPVPPDGFTYSIALLFDVAPDATNLVFFARSKPDQGWQVLSAV